MFLNDDSRLFVIKYAKFLMAGKPVSKVTPQWIPYFHRKMYLELINHAILKVVENTESDDDTT